MDYAPEEESISSKVRGGFLEMIEFVAIMAAILIIVRFFVAEPHKVDGNSMLPNFHHGDHIITNKLAVRISDMQRGEVIILKSPRDPDKVLIKRIIGLPKESLKLLEGRIYINNRLLEEPYLPTGLKTPGSSFLKEGDEVTIPEGFYFVMGDNRHASSDSRDLGPINKENFVGQAFLRYWPPQRFTILKINLPSL
ncbi:MAG: signal peptidase I [Candidatus Daviesbacteria bacterium]|nr:signal peptidase I [Candidatus Daviesbacteria bacterium]